MASLGHLASRWPCEVRTDPSARAQYATDASIYQVEPGGVAFPRGAGEVAALLAMASAEGVSITPRGAGTGLVGGAIGEGLIVDLARHNRQIGPLDRASRTIRVGAGVVLDALNAALAPDDLWFGPDVATASRATLGGMIANNSSGAHAPVYGTTVEHVVALEVVLADGRIALIGRDHPTALPQIASLAAEIVAGAAGAIEAHMPAGRIVKRWPGYGLDHALRAPGDLTRLVGGSEGTLVAITQAVLKVVPRPAERGLAVVFFDSVAEAMSATVELLPLRPAAVEHIDRIVLDQTRGQRPFQAARDLLDLEQRPAEALLLVEFFEGATDRLQALARLGLGRRTLICRGAAERALVWAVRRAGLSLLTGCAGGAKPTTCVEDVCVPPARLPEYVAELRGILEPLGVQASFYGHAASGLLHVRPKLDLGRPADRLKLRQISDEVSDLCRQFGGSWAAEHGVGMARTERLAAHVGPEISEASRRLKALFDPRGLMNPGKIVCSTVGPDGGGHHFAVDQQLRALAGSLALPAEPSLGFVDKDGSFDANLQQCNGCGGCRKATPTMCPTFSATGEEGLSTRGRANIIRAALGGRLPEAALEAALSSCLSCKACKLECPSNVDLAQLKAALLHAGHQRRGFVPLLDRLIANADGLGRLGTRWPRWANRAAGAALTRQVLERVVGLNAARPLPPYSERFDHWFAQRPRPAAPAPRGPIILWDDTWTRYHEPHIGRAAVRVLEAAGHEVILPIGRRCCGRPAFSRGLLDEARALGEHNLALLDALRGPRGEAWPIVFLEPSCWSMFADDDRQLGLPGAARVAKRAVLLESLLDALLRGAPGALPVGEATAAPVAFHVHCHARALGDPAALIRVAKRLPGAAPILLPTGCCGMAGAFGMLAKNDALSRRVAAPLIAQVRGLPGGGALVATGTSCRHQIEHLAGRRPLHIAELIAERLR